MSKSFHLWRHGLWLAIFLVSLLNLAHAQEIPNGDGDLLWKVPVSKELGTSIAIHPVNSNILLAGKDKDNKYIFEYDVNSGILIRIILIDSVPFKYGVNSLIISKDGNNLIGYSDGKLFIINYSTGVTQESNLAYFDMIFAYPNNEELLGWTGNFVQKYNYKTHKIDNSVGRTNLEKDYQNVFISAIALSLNGTQFAVAYKYFNSYHIKIFDANTFELIKSVPYSWTEIIENLEFSSTNKYLSISSNIDLLADVVNLETNQKFSFAPKHMVKFSDDEKYWIIEAWHTSPIIDIYLANTYGKVFIINADGYLSVFKDNKLFVRNGYNLSLYSSNWHFVDIKEKYSDSSFQINYSENRITLIVQNIDIIDQIFVTDTTGREVARLEKIPVINNTVQIPIELPSGNYLLKLNANGKTYTAKFLVVK